MINFAMLQGLSIPEGVVTQITDASGRVIWAVGGSDTAILQVFKVTSTTRVGETDYTDEQFILLDIYPKTNGTVSVTYGGLTKTITDTSGVEKPNAQQVFFGTFNGVSDSVSTPASGELTIEGDYYAFAYGQYTTGGKLSSSAQCRCIDLLDDFGKATEIPERAFGAFSVLADGNCNTTSIKIPNSMLSIGDYAFNGWGKLVEVYIPKSVTSIGQNPWENTSENNIISVNSANTAYRVDGNCLVEIATNRLVSGFADTIIPSYITRIGKYAFCNLPTLQNIALPAGVVELEYCCFYASGLTSLVIPASVKHIADSVLSNSSVLTSVTFENPTGWYVTSKEGATSGTSVDLSDPVNNAKLLTETHSVKHWYRS